LLKQKPGFTHFAVYRGSYCLTGSTKGATIPCTFTQRSVPLVLVTLRINNLSLFIPWEPSPWFMFYLKYKPPLPILPWEPSPWFMFYHKYKTPLPTHSTRTVPLVHVLPQVQTSSANSPTRTVPLVQAPRQKKSPAPLCGQGIVW